MFHFQCSKSKVSCSYLPAAGVVSFTLAATGFPNRTDETFACECDEQPHSFIRECRAARGGLGGASIPTVRCPPRADGQMMAISTAEAVSEKAVRHI